MPPAAHAKPTILVVDDDEGLRTLMVAALGDEGYHVSGADSGAAAIAAITARPPDLMLLDLKLRDMSGQKLLQTLRATERLVPFVVITGQGDEKVAVELMREGARDYVRKDTAMLDLLPATVQRAVGSVASERALAAEIRERRRLEAEIIEISENEQRRIGQDLHDGLGQQLTAIEILCTGLKADVARHPRVAKQVDQIARLLRESIGQVRSLARGLVPVGDQPDSLWSSLVELVDRTHALARVDCRMESESVVFCGDRELAGQLYRIAQEALNNAVKHGGGSRVTVGLKREADLLELTVRDDGGGGANDRKDSLGLRVMRHRAAVIGAELTIHSPVGKGTTVRCRVRTAK